MRTLRRTDLKSLVEFLDSLDHVEPSDFAGRMAGGLHALVPGVLTSHNEIGPHHTTISAVAPTDAYRPRDGEVFVRYAWQHPVLARFRTARSQPARAISDYASKTGLERLDLYQELYRPLAIADQISIAVPGPDNLMIAVAVARERRGFTQHDRLLLDLLRPHLAAAHPPEPRRTTA